MGANNGSKNKTKTRVMLNLEYKALSKSEIKAIPFYQDTLRYVIKDDEILVCGDDFFSSIFSSKQSHIMYLQKQEPKARLEEDNRVYDFYPLSVLNDRLVTYRIKESFYESSLLKKSDAYTNYMDFVEQGGINTLLDTFKAKDDYDSEEDYEVPDISNLKKIEADLDKAKEYVNKEEEVEEIKKPAPSRVRDFLKSENIYLYATIFLTLAVLPFTVSALYMYIEIGDSSLLKYLSVAMCLIISTAIDFSILVFSTNGKEKLARKGSRYQLIFIAAHFALIEDYLSLLGVQNTDFWQGIIVKTCIVLYITKLINQFSSLSKNDNSNKQ